MLRVLSAASLAALLAGCASIPQPKQPPVQHKAVVVKQVPKPIEVPASPAEKAKTFKERWLSKFFRNRAQ